MIERLLYATEYPVGENIALHIPTIGEIIDSGDGYYQTLDLFTAMPIDYMVQLDDLGIDFTEIDDWQLFLILFQGIRAAKVNSDLIFSNIDLLRFQVAQSEDGTELVIVDTTNGIVIDKNMYRQIADALYKIHGRERNNRKPGNEAAKKYMIEVERRKMRRRKNKAEQPELETLIVALVNTEQFKYDFDSVRSLTVYQFNESVRQVLKKVSVDYCMHGVYSGTVETKNLGKDELNWLVH